MEFSTCAYIYHPFTPKREFWVGWSSLPLFIVQASFQMINLPLHVSGVLLLRNMAFTTSLASTSMGSTYNSLLVPLPFKITEVILTLRPHRFCLMWTWTYHLWKLKSLKHQFPTNNAKMWMDLGPKSPDNEFLDSVLENWVLGNQTNLRMEFNVERMKKKRVCVGINSPRQYLKRSVLIYCF